MKNALTNMLQYTHGTGFIDLVKITGNTKETKISGRSENMLLKVDGTFNNPISEFNGIFGIPNLKKLNTIMNLPVYEGDSNIHIISQERNGEMTPTGIHFENDSGDFTNDFRFMSTEIITSKIKNYKMADIKWTNEFNPSDFSIERFRYQIKANPDYDTFKAKMEDNNLNFYFGDVSTYAGSFTFASGLGRNLKRVLECPIAETLAILNLKGNITMKISDYGIIMTVISDMATYQYTISGVS